MLAAGAAVGLAAAEMREPLHAEAAGTIGTFWDQGGAVYNVKVRGAVGNGVTDDTSAIQATINDCAMTGGIVWLPPATHAVNTGPLSIPNGVRFWGYGATITATVANVSYFFRQVAPSGGSIHDVEVRGITFAGGASAATVQAVIFDGTASNVLANYNVHVIDCFFQNCYIGVGHYGNNAGTWILATSMETAGCRFDGCVFGYVLNGSYGDWVHDCYFVLRSASRAAITVPGAMEGVNYTLTTPGTGITTICRFSRINVDGMVGDYVNGQDNGIIVAVSNSQFSDIYIAQVSQMGMYVGTQETALNNELSNIKIWGCGGGIGLDAPGVDNLITGGSITGLYLEGCGTKTNWPSWNYRQYPIWHLAGAWSVFGGAVTLPSEEGIAVAAPGYAIGTQSTNGRLTLTAVRLSAFGTGQYTATNNRQPYFQGCDGANPAAEFDRGNANTGSPVNWYQQEFGFNGTLTYKHWLSTVHNGGSPSVNRFQFYTCDGTQYGVFPTNGVLGFTIENGHTCTGQTGSAQAVASNGTIATAGPEVQRVAPSGAVTGVTLQAGTVAGQRCTVVNEGASANTITFAATGSNVADGLGTPIAGLTARSFVWDSGTQLWYRVA
jgi:hypothetical protein